VTFTPGQTTRTITVPVLADVVAEPSETFRVELTNPVGAALTDPSGVGTVRDAGIGVRVGDVVVDEGHAGVLVPAKVTVRLDRPATSVMTVKVRTIADTDPGIAPATSAVDHKPITTAKTITFKIGQVSKAVVVNVIGDAAVEGDEDFAVELITPSSGLVLADAVGHVTIRDDDPAPGTPTVSAGSVVVDEHESGPSHKAFVTVILSQPAPTNLTVKYVASSGSASAGTDYKAVTTARTLTFKAGTYKKTIPIYVYGDAIAEGDETIVVDLFNAGPGLTIGSDGLITIRDND
jgi:hypothetical protein